jgi:hypothetical protein
MKYDKEKLEQDFLGKTVTFSCQEYCWKRQQHIGEVHTFDGKVTEIRYLEEEYLSYNPLLVFSAQLEKSQLKIGTGNGKIYLKPEEVSVISN